MPTYPEATYRKMLADAVAALAKLQAESTAEIARLEAQISHLQALLA